MSVGPGTEAANELYPIVAAVGAIYGDPNGTYTNFLARVDEPYPAEPHFLWNQPLSDKGWTSRDPNYGGTTAPGNSTVTKKGTGGSIPTKQFNGSTKVVAGSISLATLSVLVIWLVA